jgi:CRISPR-associated exonuclease Cas4
MLGATVPEGAIFYGVPRRREEVAFDATLRADTARAAEEVRRLLERGITPAPEYRKRCDNCSMIDLCLPKVIGRGRSVVNYLHMGTRSD